MPKGKTSNVIISIVFFLLYSSNVSHGQLRAEIRGASINVRECPEQNCDVSFQLHKGDPCEILFNIKDENILGYGVNSWYKVRTSNKQEGYVFGAFLDFNPDEVQVNEYIKKPYSFNIQNNEVNARVCAGMTCSKAFQLNKGDVVKVLAKTEDYYVYGIGTAPWYLVEHNGQKGYVFSHFIDCSSCVFQPRKTTSSLSSVQLSTTGSITGDKVNVRDCAGIHCDVNYQLHLGDPCKVLQKLPLKQNETYNWYEISSGGHKGFVYGKYLSINTNAARKVKVWALVVGVADYSYSMNVSGANDLMYPSDDAKKIYQFLKSPMGGNLAKDQIVLLRDSESTHKNILSSASKLFQKANKNDLIIVFLSGHGGPNYFVAHDKPLMYAALKNVMELSRAQKRLCIADACYAGTWSQNAKQAVHQKTLSDTQLEDLYYQALVSTNNGIAFFLSSSKNETSLESSAFGQGLFTYYFIRGLEGEADSDGNRIVTLKELSNYVIKYVSYTAATKFNHSQNPILNGYYDSQMPIGVVKK